MLGRHACQPASDSAGEVAAVDERVTRVKVGGRISRTFHP